MTVCGRPPTFWTQCHYRAFYTTTHVMAPRIWVTCFYIGSLYCYEVKMGTKWPFRGQYDAAATTTATPTATAAYYCYCFLGVLPCHPSFHDCFGVEGTCPQGRGVGDGYTPAPPICTVAPPITPYLGWSQWSRIYTRYDCVGRTMHISVSIIFGYFLYCYIIHLSVPRKEKRKQRHEYELDDSVVQRVSVPR